MITETRWLPEWQDLEEFDVPFFAKALSRICRYGGATPHFYSVAAHSVFTSMLVPDCPRLRLLALLHDCHEVFTGDVLRPAGKILGPELRKLQAEIDEKLFSLIGFTPDDAEREIVNVADNMACELEIRFLVKPRRVVESECDVPGAWRAMHVVDWSGLRWSHGVHGCLMGVDA